MTQVDSGIMAGENGLTIGVTVNAVLHSTLDLLSSLPERPERLRVTAADVTIDLDWRTPPAALTETAVAPTVVVDAHAPAVAAATAGTVAVEEPRAETHAVCAPTIGTFYHSSQPGARPFVSVGTLVNPGQQVGIVEAMKLMLPVEADRAGRVTEILVPNGHPVEYGERLIVIEPN